MDLYMIRGGRTVSIHDLFLNTDLGSYTSVEWSSGSNDLNNMRSRGSETWAARIADTMELMEAAATRCDRKGIQLYMYTGSISIERHPRR